MLSPEENKKLEKLAGSLDYAQKKFDKNKQEAIDWAKSVNPECCEEDDETKIDIAHEDAIQAFNRTKTEARKKAKNGNKTIVISVGCTNEASDVIDMVNGGKHLYFDVSSGHEAMDIIKQYGDVQYNLIILVGQKLADGPGMGFIHEIADIRGDKILLFHGDIPSPDDVEACIKASCRPWIEPLGEKKIQRLL